MRADVVKNSRFARFFGVSTIGTAADFLIALALHSFAGVSGVAASTIGFVAGAVINYLGHHYITFAVKDGDPASVIGFAKYLGAVIMSLVVRLVVLVGLEQLAVFPFWLALSIAFVASFLSSYLVSLFWVFRGRT